jgi:hypothetical protein
MSSFVIFTASLKKDLECLAGLSSCLQCFGLWIASMTDCVNDILRGEGADQKQDERTWENFLIEKKLLIGAENKLAQILSKDDFEFSYLQGLRREYCEWKERP